MHLAHKIIISLWICASAVRCEIYEANSEIIKQENLPIYATHNTCGGFVDVRQDELTVIEYKPGEEYDNDEFCVWGIRRVNSAYILITKTTSGFEAGYDYLQISPFNQYNPSGNYMMGNRTGIEQLNINRPDKLFVVFSTDYSNTGTGFKLLISGYNQGSSRDVEDLFTVSPIGSVTLRPYMNFISRTYLIVPPLKSVGSLVLDVEYVTEAARDYLLVYGMERNGQSVHFRLLDDWLNGNGNASYRRDYYANYLVFFESDSYTVPEGGGYELSWYVPDNPTHDKVMYNFPV